MSTPEWIDPYVRERVAAEIASAPQHRAWIEEQNRITLYGTIGHHAILRPDGSVWFYEVVNRPARPDTYQWRRAEGLERIGALSLGLKRFPELAALLPQRPRTAPDCPRCKGHGEIGGVVCPDCASLGWVPEGAA